MNVGRIGERICYSSADCSRLREQGVVKTFKRGRCWKMKIIENEGEEEEDDSRKSHPDPHLPVISVSKIQHPSTSSHAFHHKHNQKPRSSRMGCP